MRPSTARTLLIKPRHSRIDLFLGFRVYKHFVRKLSKLINTVNKMPLGKQYLSSSRISERIAESSPCRASRVMMEENKIKKSGSQTEQQTHAECDHGHNRLHAEMLRTVLPTLKTKDKDDAPVAASKAKSKPTPKAKRAAK